MTVGIQTSLYLLTGMAEGASLLSSFGKESACSAGDLGLIPGSGKIPWRRKWQPTPVFLLEKLGFSGDSDNKESACNAGDLGLIPGSGKILCRREWHTLKYSYLENPVE